MIELDEIVEIDYTNWKGERRLRLIQPHGIMFRKHPPYHDRYEWLLHAQDVRTKEFRFFAMKDIHSWKPLNLKRDHMSLTPEEKKKLEETGQKIDNALKDFAHGLKEGSKLLIISAANGIKSWADDLKKVVDEAEAKDSEKKDEKAP